MDSLIRDARFALRSMTSEPAFTAVGVIIIALGIGPMIALGCE